jgi:hypothetical protein
MLLQTFKKDGKILLTGQLGKFIKKQCCYTDDRGKTSTSIPDNKTTEKKKAKYFK